MKRKTLSISILLALIISTFAYAKDTDIKDKKQEETITIKAEDIGIEVVKNENVVAETEDKVLDEIVKNEDKEDAENTKEEKVESYVSGEYKEPNTVECEICGGKCYICHDGHTYVHSVYMEENHYILEEWCTICGHGTSEVISNEEFELLGVETDVEF
jgi:hypothetical protein